VSDTTVAPTDTAAASASRACASFGKVSTVVRSLQHARSLPLQAAEQVRRGVLHDQLHRADVRRDQIGERAAVRQAAIDEDPDPIADRFHVGEDVRGEQDRPALLAELEDEIADLLAADGIEAAHRLVQDDDPGIRDERLREREPLHHALGELADGPVGAAAGEADALEQLGCAAARVRAGKPAKPSGEDEILVAAEELV